ncbi:uncharacterized protein LOC135467534 [Liolophura sinensis]|uniref:uncharacterized protein LOC135467534 n=1 Tax=Liolophura sinensis TaxID=3198878 RepID=UPI0031588AA9
MERPWVNFDGNWEVYPWQNVNVKIPVLRVSSSSGVSVYDTWVSGPSSSLSEVGLHLNLNSPLTNTFYKHPIVNGWENWNIAEVRIILYKHMIEVVSLTFDGLDTNAMSWFAKSQLLTSPWKDLKGSSTNFLGIEGSNGNRRFFISSHYSGCGGDYGWFVVLDADDHCGWTTRSAYPAFSYVSGSSKQNWLSGAVRDADDLVIFVTLYL